MRGRIRIVRVHGKGVRAEVLAAVRRRWPFPRRAALVYARRSGAAPGAARAEGQEEEPGEDP
ncbi:MAG: hypothetical protein ACE5GS_13945 [Kiloniellaceae bacterium]